MQFYSTNNPSLRVEFQEAVFNSLPADNGLYMPVNIPVLDVEFLQNIDHYSITEIAFKVAHALLEDSIPEDTLRSIIDDAINFPAPVVQVDDKTYVLELFHGPSLAFKDFGARFMSRVMSYYLNEGEDMLDILVATSGDTGGAVAAGFLGVPNTRVTILYPQGKVSDIQELQITTNGQNITAIEVEGTFDDCQALVKEAFNDADLNKTLRLTSANSINIARLIPQTFYYFHAYAELKRKGITGLIFSVPSGNFGNIGAGLLAWKMGLPVKKFLAATNVNDTVPMFLETGIYEPRKSIQTISNAMDVGNPSNWVRVLDLFKNDISQVRQMVTSYSFDDANTLAAIQDLYNNNRYIACPHTAIAWLGIEAWRNEHPEDQSTAVFLSTAHPCKFPEAYKGTMLEKVLVQTPFSEDAEKRSIKMTPDFESFKHFLLSTK